MIKLSFFILFCWLSTLALGQPDLQKGLVAYYPFNGNAKNTVKTGNKGILYQVVREKDRFGVPNAAFGFNGINSRISLPINAMEIQGVSCFSMSYWIYIQQLETEQTIFANWIGDIAEPCLPIGFNSTLYENMPYTTFVAGNGPIANTSLPTKKWTHVVLLYNGAASDNQNRFKLYINNELLSVQFDPFHYCSNTIPETIGTKGEFCSVGARKNGEGEWFAFFNGKIDDIAFWNRLLDEVEIKTLFTSGFDKEKKEPKPNLPVTR